MCGLFGWVTAKERCLGKVRLQELTSLLVHRGPDGRGAELRDTADSKYSIGLAHQRLSILDLTEAATQPMWSRDRRYCLIYNGEIYNYVELKQELAQHGIHVTSTGDTEVLLAALIKWGEKTLGRLRGMFAFALLDTKEDSILFARDINGKKPLYFGHKGNDLFFSSEIHPLTQVPGFDCAMDTMGLNNFLLDRFVVGPRTFFKNIEKLPAASFATWRKGKLTIEKYFVPDPQLGEVKITDYGEALRLFDAIFDESVRIRMQSDAPIGAFLSGGLDSSAVVAYMCQHSSRAINTYSVNFSETGFSEAQFANVASSHFKTDHHELTVTPEDFFSNWDQAILHRGAPVSEASDIPMMMLARATRKSATVVLTGEGADEFFAGYPKYIAEGYSSLYRRLIPAALHRRLVEPLIQSLPYSSRRLKVLSKAFGEREIDVRMRVWFGGLTPEECVSLLPTWLNNEEGHLTNIIPGKNTAMQQLLKFDQQFWLPDNTLERGDRMLMAASVEGRMPFMDTELSKFAARLPDHFLVKGGVGKKLLRDAMRNKLPEELVHRSKNGFRVPIHAWFQGSHAHIVKDLLVSESARVRRLLDPNVIDCFVKEHMEGVSNHERILWSLCNLELFLRVYKQELPTV